MKFEYSGPPVLVTDGKQVLFEQINQQADINCQIEHNTDTRPSWYFNNVPIVSDGSIYTIRKRNLRILTMTMERGGWYTCVASNVHGTAMKDILVVPAGERTVYIKLFCTLVSECYVDRRLNINIGLISFV